MPTFFGDIGSSGAFNDQAVNLIGGVTYYIELEGFPSGQGTLGDPFVEIFDSFLGLFPVFELAENDDGGIGNNARLVFTPGGSGTYFIRSRGFGSATGTYRLNVEPDDFRADAEFGNTGALGAVTVDGGGSFGTINYNGSGLTDPADADWFAVSLTIGRTYEFSLEGSATGQGTLADPFLRLLDSLGGQILVDDDQGAGFNSRIVYTATSSGTFYLSAQEYLDDATGSYRLSARLLSTDFDDSIVGTDFNDTITGQQGSDTIDGGSGDDSLLGDDGTEVTFGGVESDSLIGGFGNDTLLGGDDFDTLVGGDGNDSLDGGIDGDSLNGGAGNDTLLGGDATDFFDSDTLDGGAGDDSLDGEGENDSLQGGAGNDTLVGGSGADTLDGGAGNDTVFGGAGNDLVSLGSGDDRYDDTGGGNDTIDGGAGNDFIFGFTGNESYVGGDGNDTLLGDSGNDSFSGGAGNDSIDGATDTDTVDYSTAGFGISFISNGEILKNGGAAGTDTLRNVERVIGSAGFIDVIDGQTSSIGNGRYVNVDLGAGIAVVEINPPGVTVSQTIVNFDNVIGSSKDDFIRGADFGSNANNLLTGEQGNDTLVGTRGFDILNGGIGVDTADYTNLGAQVTLKANGVVEKGVGGSAGTDTIQFMERVVGAAGFNNAIDGSIIGGGPAAFNVNLAAGTLSVTGVASFQIANFVNVTGTSNADTIAGNSANNTLVGGSGNDVIIGGSGNDSVNGETGSDTADYSTAGFGISFISNGEILKNGGAAGTDTLRNVERVVGSAGFIDVIDGQTSSIGNGRYVNVDLGAGVAVVEINPPGVTVTQSIVNFDNVIGSSKDDFIRGADSGPNANNLLTGEQGNDTLVGTGGFDILNGGIGVDTADYTNLGAQVTLKANGVVEKGVGGSVGTDTIQFMERIVGATGFNNVIDGSIIGGGPAAFNVDLAAGTLSVTGVASFQIANFVNVTGTANADTIAGNSGNNTLNGWEGADILFGGGGNDLLEGGLGNDSADGGVGNDTLNGFGDNDTLLAGVGNDSVIGNVGNDSLDGGTGNDTLTGASGADTLLGGIGNDSLDGGGGNDTATYASAGSAVTVNLSLAAAQNTGGGGIDTLLAIENVIGSGFNDTLIGSGGANVLDGAAGNDNLVGGGGNDTLSGGAGNDTLDGGVGNDTLDGGAGTDTATYASAGSAVTVNLSLAVAQNTIGAGIDTLVAIENLIGSAFNDVLTGNGGVNLLDGAAGNDTLSGGGGIDTLVGGFGNDTLDGGLGNDRIDGGAGIDAVSYTSATSGVSVNLALAGAQDTGGAGIDTLVAVENLYGSSFADVLLGSAGANVLRGDLGADTLTGSAGTDTFDFNLIGDSGVGAANRDLITDFVGVGATVGDRIDLADVFGGVLSFIGTSGFTAVGQVRVDTSGANTLVQVNTVGVTGAEMEILVQDGAALPSQWVAGDFIL